MTAHHLQPPGCISHSHARKDYGAAVRVWDKGPSVADRYTLMPPRSRRAAANWREGDLWMALAAGPEPFHPQGFGQHSTGMPGPHLGKRIHWNELPPEVQRFARLSFLGEYCPPMSNPAPATTAGG